MRYSEGVISKVISRKYKKLPRGRLETGSQRVLHTVPNVGGLL